MNNRKPFNKLFNNVLSSAKPPEEKGLGVRVEGKGRTEAREVSLTPQIIEDIFNEQDGKCALSGADLDLDALYIPNSPLAPSVDRISNNFGYHRDNVHIVLRFVNMGRGESQVNEAVAAINSIKAAEYELGPWYFPPIPYEEIFYKPISNVLEWAKLGFINILTAPMGVGKTYTTFRHLIKELKEKKGVQVFWYFAPNCDNLPEREFNSYLNQWAPRNVELVVVGGKDGKCWDKAKEHLDGIKNGDTVIYVSTDASLANILFPNGKLGEAYHTLRALGDKFCLIRDEIHYGSTSDPAIVPENVGGTVTDKYKARMFNVMDSFVDTTPWNFGLTATATKEQLTKGLGTDKYQVVNGWVSPKDCIANSAWIGKIYQTLNLKRYHDDDYVKASMRKLISSIDNRTLAMDRLKDTYSDVYPILDKLITKTCAMIKVDRTTEKALIENHKAHIKRVNELLLEVGIPKDWTYIITNSKGWTEYDSNGFDIQTAKGEGWVTEMNKPDGSARILIVVDKGDKGINIPLLTDGLIFRNPTPRDKKEKKWIVRNALQLLGRWVRKNWGGLDLEELNSLPRDISYQILSQLNTFDIEVPKSEQWEQAVEEFTHPKDGYAVYAHEVLGFPFQRKRAA